MVPEALHKCLWTHHFNYSLFVEDTPPLTKRHHRIWTFSIVPRTFTQRSVPDSRAGEKYITALKNVTKKTLCTVLTGEQRPSTSVIHSGSAVRPELPEPWCSIWEQPAGPPASSPPPISKLSPSVGRMEKRKKKKDERGMWRRSFNYREK